MIRKSRNDSQFSKWIVKMILIVMIITVNICIFMFYETGSYPEIIITQIMVITGSVISLYFGKAGFENTTKIKESDMYGNPASPYSRGENE